MALDRCTEAHVQSLAATYRRELGLVLVDREDDILMEATAKVLDVVHSATLGLVGMSGRDWMENYATTMAERVSMPRGWSPAQRLIALAHEAEHVVQWQGKSATDLPGTLGDAWLYLTSSEARVRYEADAERAAIEAQWLTTGALPGDLAFVAHRFDGYLFGTSAPLMNDLLEVGVTQLRSTRHPSTRAGTIFEMWLHREAPELLAEAA